MVIVHNNFSWVFFFGNIFLGCFICLWSSMFVIACLLFSIIYTRKTLKVPSVVQRWTFITVFHFLFFFLVYMRLGVCKYCIFMLLVSCVFFFTPSLFFCSFVIIILFVYLFILFFSPNAPES